MSLVCRFCPWTCFCAFCCAFCFCAVVTCHLMMGCCGVCAVGCAGACCGGRSFDLTSWIGWCLTTERGSCLAWKDALRDSLCVPWFRSSCANYAPWNCGAPWNCSCPRMCCCGTCLSRNAAPWIPWGLCAPPCAFSALRRVLRRPVPLGACSGLSPTVWQRTLQDP